MKGDHEDVSDFFIRSSVLHDLSQMVTVDQGKSSHRVRVLSVCAGHFGVVQSMGSDGVPKKKILLSKVVTTGSSTESVVWDLLLGLEGTGVCPSRLHCVSHGPDGST